MPTTETTSEQAHVPFHSCISLEDVNRARTSAIDAEWDALSPAPLREGALPTVAARPRFQTLPGLGPESELTAAAKARRSRRWAFITPLVAALAVFLTLIVVFARRGVPELLLRPAPAPSVQPNLAARLAAPPPPLPSSELARPLTPTRIAEAHVPPPAAKLEALPTKPVRKLKPQPRAVTEAPTARLLTASNSRSARLVASTDNPY